LTESATNELLRAANFEPLDAQASNGKEEISIADFVPPSQVFNVHSVRSDPSREFEVRIRDIQDLLTSLEQKIGSQEGPNELKNGLQQQIGDLEAAVGELKTKSSELTAPIKLPELQKIAVKLIPTTSFEALEGHRADENRWTGVTSLFAGSALGIVINLNKSASPTPNCGGRFARRRSLARAAVDVGLCAERAPRFPRPGR
jgi:hypothetical protein